MFRSALIVVLVAFGTCFLLTAATIGLLFWLGSQGTEPPPAPAPTPVVEIDRTGPVRPRPAPTAAPLVLGDEFETTLEAAPGGRWRATLRFAVEGAGERGEVDVLLLDGDGRTILEATDLEAQPRDGRCQLALDLDGPRPAGDHEVWITYEDRERATRRTRRYRISL